MQLNCTVCLLGRLSVTCGGTLINSRNVLSAAHCTIIIPSIRVAQPNAVMIYLGQHLGLTPERSSDGVEAQVCGISIHPNYRLQTGGADFSVLRLTNPVIFNDRIAPACLPAEHMSGNFLINEMLVASGWGKGSEVEGKSVLFSVELPGVRNDECSKLYDAFFNVSGPDFLRYYVTENMLCAGEPDSNKTTCSGDSGGMLSQFNIHHSNNGHYN